ncbi:uncharacterized protein KIAA1958-like [Diadema antillarum]|uniref:uncharacterized protein KIAA1958-like n=1 Tax=Diadema antillarum TaxID=105358 RepID=UPI003A8AB328
MAASSYRRFGQFTDKDLDDFITSVDSENTRKQIKYGLSVFREFCSEVGENFEDLSLEGLDGLLSQFYAGARNKKGELYSKKSMQAIRFGLQRHFMETRGVDIVKGEQFPRSNKTFKALLVKLKASGKANVKHHPPITSDDMVRIQASLDLDTAEGLQRKVFLDTMIYFANRGMENVRDMTTNDFVLHVEGDSEYFTLRDMHTKNHQTDEGESQGGQMHAMKGNPRCPVMNMKKYLSRLNPLCDWMWQRPKQRVSDEDGVWYANSPLGKWTLSKMTTVICEAAGCSKHYTNHSLRATSITLLDHAGYASRDIMSVSGHRSESSIKNYARTSEQTKRQMSNTLSTIHPDQPSTSVPHPDQPSTSALYPDQPSTSTASLDDKENDDIDDDGMPDFAIDISNSQLLRILTCGELELPDQQPQLSSEPPSPQPQPQQDRVFRTMNMNQQNLQPQQYHFHGCVVNFYNK